ncbi:MAG: toxin-antitoxin system TumE family protein [Acidiferrobacterales bacterium]
MVNGQCVVHYDNEAGKGDHRHVGKREMNYRFTTIESLLTDFRKDTDNWRI